MTTFDEAVSDLRLKLSKSAKAHSPFADSFYHNGGTVLALAATTTATLLPESLTLWARIAAAVATFIIAVSRALDFGGRWRWHTQMRNAYTALLDKVSQLDVLADADRPAAAKQIFDELIALRGRENTIPGASAPTEP